MNHYDVAICGGGLAGLTLAYQLKREFPKQKIILLEKTERPLSEAAHKVGESTVEIGAHYLSHVLGLKEYLLKKQLPKLGLRYFYSDGDGSFENRSELGVSMFSPVLTHQLDRGLLENDLRDMIEKAGVTLKEGVSIGDIIISESGSDHEIQFSKNEVQEKLTATWVIDAMGRRRYLQAKFKLKKENGHGASSAWFRLKGKINVSDIASKSNHRWQERNIEDRYYSTNHLMGKGYWVWLIPLSSGNTSIGIVAQNNIHPFDSYALSYETAFEWLKKHEPALAKFIEGREPLDFRKIKNYSYSSSQVFSEHRWACTGEAGIFSDPFYSPGSDLISICNTLITNLIRADLDGKFSKSQVDLLNDTFLQVINNDLITYFRDSYHVFGNTQVASAKFLWDTTYYWSVYAHTFMNGYFSDMEFVKEYAEVVKRFSKVNKKVQQLFRVWAQNTQSEKNYEFCDLARKFFFIKSAVELLTTPEKKDYNKFLLSKLKTFDKLAHALYFLAKRQVPEAVLNTGMANLDYETPYNAAVDFISYTESDVKNELSVFKEFFGPYSKKEEAKIQFATKVSRIRNGAFLYFVRKVYLEYCVKMKDRVHLQFMLRSMYAD